MKTEEAKQLLKPFIDECEKSKDPFFVCHFSRQEDKYWGDFEELDSLDAGIIIRQLVKKFNLSPLFLSSLIEQKETA